MADLLKSLGPREIGYAYLQTQGHPRVGLCVRHRPDGSPRLVFDLTVNYGKRCQIGLPHGRRVGVEFALRCPEPLPPDIAVLIGHRSWVDLAGRFQPPGSDRWRDWPVDCDTTSVWRGEVLSLVGWAVELRWPVSQSRAGVLPPPCAGVWSPELALWHGREPVCALNPDWLGLEKYGLLIIDDETTCFFPNRAP